jgi:hypothetical protein
MGASEVQLHESDEHIDGCCVSYADDLKKQRFHRVSGKTKALRFDDGLRRDLSDIGAFHGHRGIGHASSLSTNTEPCGGRPQDLGGMAGYQVVPEIVGRSPACK